MTAMPDASLHVKIYNQTSARSRARLCFESWLGKVTSISKR